MTITRQAAEQAVRAVCQTERWDMAEDLFGMLANLHMYDLWRHLFREYATWQGIRFKQPITD